MIYITQCKCPSDHCLLAVAWEGEPSGLVRLVPYMTGELKKGFNIAVQRKMLNPLCGLCASRDFHYTTHATGWKTIEEAQPHLLKSEAEQLLIAGIPQPHADRVRTELRLVSSRDS